jgi:hypothetical protein
LGWYNPIIPEKPWMQETFFDIISKDKEIKKIVNGVLITVWNISGSSFRWCRISTSLKNLLDAYGTSIRSYLKHLEDMALLL